MGQTQARGERPLKYIVGRPMHPLLPRVEKLPMVLLLRAWRPHLAELGLIVGLYLVYLLSRGLVFRELDQTGVQNAHQVIALEQSFGFFWEPGWQAWALAQARSLVVAANWIYIITYWPIVLGVGLVLYLRDRRRFYHYRTVVVVSLAIAFAVFLLFPVASPFRIPAYFVNTIQVFGPSYYGSPEMAVYYNTNAAMPSLHFCWTAVLGVLFLQSLRGWFKLVGPVYPAITFLAITVTGNHFILDAAGGGLLAGLSFGVVALARRRRRWVFQ